MFDECEAWGAIVDETLAGFIAFPQGWIDQPYVLPSAQDRGARSNQLAHAQASQAELALWTFQRNAGARLFYEARGFVAERLTDGAGNEEKEPDVLYRWRRG